MFGRIMTLIVLGAAIVLGVMLQSTSPVTAGPGGILTVFFCMYLVLLGTSALVVRLLSWVYAYFRSRSLQGISTLSIEHSFYYGSVIAFGPTILLAISSVGSLGLYEYILVFLFLSVGIFYIRKRL